MMIPCDFRCSQIGSNHQSAAPRGAWTLISVRLQINRCSPVFTFILICCATIAEAIILQVPSWLLWDWVNISEQWLLGCPQHWVYHICWVSLNDWLLMPQVWGLFMDEHVFPGADASCPMGWVGQPSPENFMVSELIFPVNCHFFGGIPWTNSRIWTI